MLAMERIGLFYQVPAALEGRPICDFITSEYGVALLLDQHVNRRGDVITTLVEALTYSRNRQEKEIRPSGRVTMRPLTSLVISNVVRKQI